MGACGYVRSWTALSASVMTMATLTFLAVACVPLNAVADPFPASVSKLESKAAACANAAAAARIYTVALTSGSLEGSDRQAAEARRAHWLKLADEGRRRIGRDWLNAEEREKLEAESDRFIQQGFEMIRLGNGRLAEDHLKEASRRFPESGRADMILGLIYTSVVGDNRRAAVHFSEVIKREPGNGYAYNNFALTALAERKYSVAIRNFRKALELMPDSQELSDNLAIMLGMLGTGQLIMPENEVVAVSDLYRLAIHDLGLQPYQPPQANQQGQGMADSSFGGGSSLEGGSSMLQGSAGYGGGSGGLSSSGALGGEMEAGGYGSGGYGPGSGGQGGPGDGGAGVVGFAYFTPFGRPVRGRLALDAATIDRLLDDPDEMVTQVWSGTGVAVAEGYVLTTLDVVGDATKVLIRKPDTLGIFLEADVVTSSDETGLVLLDCMDLEAPAIPIDAKGAGSGKVLVGGFPGGLAERLTGTVSAAKAIRRGAGDDAGANLVVAFPKRENAEACGIGGIVLGASGGLVGLIEGAVAAGSEGEVAEEGGSAAGGYGVAASVATIRAFLEEELDEEITEVSTKPSGWADVAKAASDSAVFVYAKKVRPGKPKPQVPQVPQGFAGAGGPGFGGATGFGPAGPGYGSGYGSGVAEEPGSGYGSSPQGYGSQPPGLSPMSMGLQSPGSSAGSYGSGSQPPGSSPGSYGSSPPPGSSPGSYGSQPPGSSPGSYGSQPPGSSPGSYGSQPPGSSPGSYGSQPPGSSPGSYGSQPPGSSPQSYGSGSMPQGSSPQSYGSGSSSEEEDVTAGEGEGEEMEGDQERPGAAEGASFSPGEYPLAQQSVLGGALSLLLPSGFEPMSEQMLQTKYPGANRPTLVYTNSTGSINIAINHTQNAVQPSQLKQLHQALDSATRKQVPDGNWRFSGFQTYSGTEWVQLEFLSEAADTRIENMMAATSVDGRMLVVSFNVTEELAGEWLPVGREIIQSLQAGGK